jgi:hypothetical protein
MSRSGQRLADAQTAARGMHGAGFFVHAADPAFAHVVFAMAAEDLVHLFDEPLGEFEFPERDEVADRECVGPQIAARRQVPDEACALGEGMHEPGGRAGGVVDGERTRLACGM